MKADLSYLLVRTNDDLGSVGLSDSIWDVLESKPAKYISGLEIGIDIDLNLIDDIPSESDGEYEYTPDIETEYGIVEAKKFNITDIPSVLPIFKVYVNNIITSNAVIRDSLLNYRATSDIMADVLTEEVMGITVGKESDYHLLFSEIRNMIDSIRAILS